MQVKVGGALKTVSNIQVNIGGVLKQVDSFQVNIGGVLKTAWTNSIAVPSGTVLPWSGAIASIPSGWGLCDGNSGRPNMVDAFIMGHGDESVGATGGTSGRAHTHTLASTGHTHGSNTDGGHDGGHSDDYQHDDTFPHNYPYGEQIGTENTIIRHGYHTSAGEHSHGTSGSATSDHGLSSGSDPEYYVLAFIIKS